MTEEQNLFSCIENIYDAALAVEKAQELAELENCEYEVHVAACKAYEAAKEDYQSAWSVAQRFAEQHGLGEQQFWVCYEIIMSALMLRRLEPEETGMAAEWVEEWVERFVKIARP